MYRKVNASQYRLFTSSVKPLTALTGTANVDFGIVTGPIHIHRLFLVVRSALGNHTDAKFAGYDGTTTLLLTNTSGPTMTNFVAGTTGFKCRLSTSAVSLAVGNGGSIIQYNPAYGDVPFFFQVKIGTTTYLRYTFTTTDNPTIGSMQFSVLYEPLSDNATITPA